MTDSTMLALDADFGYQRPRDVQRRFEDAAE